MSSNPERAYESLVAQLRETEILGSCASVLGWDEQTYLPSGGTEQRSRQLSLLAGMVHERSTDPRIGAWLHELEQSNLIASPESDIAVNVREARRDYDRATKLSRRLVEELSRVCSLAQQAWVEARKHSAFPSFQPWLEQIVALKREEAQAIGYGSGVPYDALLDAFEPGVTTATVQNWFTPLREDLVKLLQQIQGSGRTPDVSILTRHYPVEAQRSFSKFAAARIGFDFSRGRLDEAPHPFCSGHGPGDTRLTTRYDPRHFPGAFFGTLHEAGHGIYDQGLPSAAYGTPLGQAVSLGIHESQSRLWENFVGRSRAFWEGFFAPAQAVFPEALGNVSLADFYFAVNDVRPSFIRVEADEVTYNLHIMLRFELEQQLIAGQLSPADVPTAWNEAFTRSFGLTPPDAAHGCLQDIHWSGGGIGYFPTYSLGNMFAAQFFHAASQQLDSLPRMIARGDFHPLKQWLNEQIHQPGKRYRSQDLVARVTGSRLSHTALVTHLRNKFSELYHL